jgi:tRNA (guanine37-N1)-methyltransferase
LIPGALGGEDAAEKDSFTNGLLEHAHYTRPRTFEDKEVPEILLSGHHREIEKWRLKSSLIRTFLKRPDLLQEKILNSEEIEILENWHRDIEEILKSKSKDAGEKREDK